MGEDVKPYLEYLDKEMTIMGVLSAFAVAAPALVLSQVAGADNNSLFTRLWLSQQAWFMVGSVSLLFCGLCFYRQRSLLAYYYGQICLTLVSGFPTTKSRDEWLKDADSWATWLKYRWGFGLMVLGFVAYGMAFVAASWDRLARLTPWLLPTLVALTVVVCGCQSLVLTRLSHSAEPWTVVRRFMRKRVSGLARRYSR